MSGYTIVAGPPGVELDNCVRVLADTLGGVPEDIETHIKRNPATAQRLSDLHAAVTSDTPDMNTITHELPRAMVGELWRAAAASALSRLQESDSPTKLLSLHMIYYSGKRREFYSVVDAQSLRYSPRRMELSGERATGLSPDRIVILIDDVFDMYVRLTQPGWVFSLQRIGDYLKRLSEARRFDLPDLPKEHLTRLTRGAELDDLLRCLSWRYMEVVAAETLGLQLGLVPNRVVLWPVKQSVDPLVKWINGDNDTLVYVSHPITEVRKQYRSMRGAEGGKTAQWPEYARQEINEVPELCSNRGLSVVSPTGIDEYRLEVSGVMHTGRLEPRWPVPAGPGTRTLYFQPELGERAEVMGQAPDYEGFFARRYWDLQERSLARVVPNRTPSDEDAGQGEDDSDSVLEVVASEIEWQVSARDFFELYHSDGILVVRPYYGGRATFSRGVKAEVALWEDLVNLGSAHRAAIVHFASDVDGVIESTKETLPGNAVDRLHAHLKGHRPFEDRRRVQDLVLARGKLSRLPSILDQSGISEAETLKLERGFPGLWHRVKEELLEALLAGPISVETLDPRARACLGIWVVEDAAEFRGRCLDEVCSFFKGGPAPVRDWLDRIEEWLPDTVVRLDGKWS